MTRTALQWGGAGGTEVQGVITTCVCVCVHVSLQSRRQHIGVYDDIPVEPEVQEELPDWSYSDWRAYAEKHRQYELLDIEWRRRQVCTRTQHMYVHTHTHTQAEAG